MPISDHDAVVDAAAAYVRPGLLERISTFSCQLYHDTDTDTAYVLQKGAWRYCNVVGKGEWEEWEANRIDRDRDRTWINPVVTQLWPVSTDHQESCQGTSQIASPTDLNGCGPSKKEIVASVILPLPWPSPRAWRALVRRVEPISWIGLDPSHG